MITARVQSLRRLRIAVAVSRLNEQEGGQTSAGYVVEKRWGLVSQLFRLVRTGPVGSVKNRYVQVEGALRGLQCVRNREISDRVVVQVNLPVGRRTARVGRVKLVERRRQVHVFGSGKVLTAVDEAVIASEDMFGHRRRRVLRERPVGKSLRGSRCVPLITHSLLVSQHRRVWHLTRCRVVHYVLVVEFFRLALDEPYPAVLRIIKRETLHGQRRRFPRSVRILSSPFALFRGVF